MTAFTAWIAAALATGGWLGLRWAETNQRLNRDLASIVMAIDIDRAAADDGDAETGQELSR